MTQTVQLELTKQSGENKRANKLWPFANILRNNEAGQQPTATNRGQKPTLIEIALQRRATKTSTPVYPNQTRRQWHEDKPGGGDNATPSGWVTTGAR